MKAGAPSLQPHFCSVDWDQSAWGPQNQSSPLQASASEPPRTLASKEPAVSRLLLPHPSLRLSLNPGLPGCWSPADTPELSRVLSQAKASAGGGQEEPPPIPSSEFSRVGALLCCASPTRRWEAPGREAHSGGQAAGLPGPGG